MAKREFVDKQALLDKMEELDWQDLYLPVHYKDFVIDETPIVTEQEIARPYLTKLRSDIVASIEDIKGKYDNTVPEHDRPLCKCARNEARLEIIEWIDGLLAELGDKGE